MLRGEPAQKGVCLSVLKCFFFRSAVGQYDLEPPRQLQGLLATKARNKLAAGPRRQHRQRRDNRWLAGDGEGELQRVADNDRAPARNSPARTCGNSSGTACTTTIGGWPNFFQPT